MKNYTKFLFLLTFCFAQISAQNEMPNIETKTNTKIHKKHTLLINASYMLNPENQSYALLYKRNLNKMAFRFGVSNANTSFLNSQFFLNNKFTFGIEKYKQEGKWRHNYGIDIAPSFALQLRNNAQQERERQVNLGLEVRPFLGTSYQIHEKISLGAELQVPFLQHSYRNGNQTLQHTRFNFVPKASFLVGFKF